LRQYVNIEATAEEIATRLTMGGLEVEGIEESALGPVLDVYVTPNRGDCLSVVGVAREVAALYGLPLQAPAPPPSSGGGPTAEQTSVTIEDFELCPRYAARLVRGVKIEPSPDWMQARLEAAGQRPINNVVDVTNYVMLELGQPLHAFDLDRLAGGRIVVRRARDGERLTTLDGGEHALTPAMLVIADAEKAVALAGIMGGASSEVSDTTTNLLLESAHFDPLSVRRTARTLGLRTEASYRFERIVDPEGVRRAVDRACQLLAEIGQPEAVPGVVDIAAHPHSPRVVALRVHRATELLGMEITAHIAADSLRALGFEVRTLPESRGETDTLEVVIPSFRPDITLEEDLIEEVGRIYGYENIPETLPRGDTTQGGDSAEGVFLQRVRQVLVACGLQEVVTHSLTAPSFFDTPDDAARRVAIRNALSEDISGLRRSLIPTLLDVAERNATRGQHALAIFEAGRVWQNEPSAEGGITPTEYVAIGGLLIGPMTEPGWQRDVAPMPADFSTARGIVERLLEGVGIEGAALAPIGEKASALPQFHPGRTAFLYLHGERPAGIVGEVHPRVIAKLGLRERAYAFEISAVALQRALPPEGPRYRPLSRFPAVSRDLAPRVPVGLLYAEVEAAVRAADAPLLESLQLTDVFAGPPLPEGTKSFTLSLTFRAPDRTLTDAEITDSLARIREQLEARCGATFAG
jgi:phenylalanyl-tRNA synthetase beta chain